MTGKIRFWLSVRNLIKEIDKFIIESTFQILKIKDCSSADKKLREYQDVYREPGNNDQRSGFGYEYSSLGVYVGFWKSGKRSGFGHFMSKYMKYKGNWENDKPSSFGQIEFKRGAKKASYKGGWRNGIPHGKGEYKTPQISIHRKMVKRQGKWIGSFLRQLRELPTQAAGTAVFPMEKAHILELINKEKDKFLQGNGSLEPYLLKYKQKL